MKTNQITFKVAKVSDSSAKAFGIAVASEGSLATHCARLRRQTWSDTCVTEQ